MQTSINVIILAAGNGTRMASNGIPKVLHHVAGKPIILHVLNLAQLINPAQIICVTNPAGGVIRNTIDEQNIVQKLIHAIQILPQGTGDGVKCALPHIDNSGISIILYGDHPLISQGTIDKLITKLSIHDEYGALVVGFHKSSPNQYGRLILEGEELKAIIEYSDASEEERKITLCNSGIIAINNKYIHNFIAKIDNHNHKNEYYLTDIIKIANKENIKCSYITGDELELVGVNTQEELAQAEEIFRQRLF